MPAEGIELTPKAHLMTSDEIVQIATTLWVWVWTKSGLPVANHWYGKDASDIILRLGELGTELTITTNGLLVHKFIGI
jgi:cyclic pyranopterin phosphate synthase